MIVVYVLVVLAVLFVAAVVATRDDDVLAEAPPDQADLRLPADSLQPEDVAEIRFGLTLRGYRMSEVDRVLARVAEELAVRDRRLAELEQALADEAERVLAEAMSAADADGAGETTQSTGAAPSFRKVPTETGVVAQDPAAVHVPVTEPVEEFEPAADEPPAPGPDEQADDPAATGTDERAAALTAAVPEQTAEPDPTAMAVAAVEAVDVPQQATAPDPAAAGDDLTAADDAAFAAADSSDDSDGFPELLPPDAADPDTPEATDEGDEPPGGGLTPPV